MASQKDVQELIRLLTTGRNKLPMIAAMGRIKALQAAHLRSISEIAATDLQTLTAAIDDERAAKSLLTACKAVVKDPSSSTAKRTAPAAASPPSKRKKSAYELAAETPTLQELEASLALPGTDDQEKISETVLWTNRAPLVLAFAVALLKYTMPEQPLSSRLSLAQAVVSANSRSKAVSLGLEKTASAEIEGWGRGQPRVKVLGRDIYVLKRGGYEWKTEEATKEKESDQPSGSSKTADTKSGGNQSSWSVSESVTSKQSTFIARAIQVTSPAQARSTIQNLLSVNTELRGASHNITAWRCLTESGHVVEESNDDGEAGGGRHALQLLQTSDATNMLVVISRWYGGVMLGPDRWRIMSQVSRDALAQRLRVAGILGTEALWALDLETMKDKAAPVTGGTAAGMPIYNAESARAYLLKSFLNPPPPEGEEPKKKKTAAVLDAERELNLGLLLGALNLLFSSWVQYISRDELDRRAWAWYVQVRPDVEHGVAGWGGKGEVKLADILNLCRKGK